MVQAQERYECISEMYLDGKQPRRRLCADLEIEVAPAQQLQYQAESTILPISSVSF
jgi:hypothetical protein